MSRAPRPVLRGMTVKKSVGPGQPNKFIDVITVQSLLYRHRAWVAMGPFKVNGAWNKRTEHAIRRFQRVMLGSRHATGKVTRRGQTIRALNAPTSFDPNPRYYYPPGPQGVLAAEARRFIGARETGNNGAGGDARMWEIFLSDSWAAKGRTDGYAWCCALVSRCIQVIHRRYKGVYGHLTPPTASLVALLMNEWATDQECYMFTADDPYQTPSIGDIVSFNHFKLGSHIGIVDGIVGDKIHVIEGNTDDKGSREGVACLRKERSLQQLDKFIRLPVPIGNTEWHDWGSHGPKTPKPDDAFDLAKIEAHFKAEYYRLTNKPKIPRSNGVNVRSTRR